MGRGKTEIGREGEREIKGEWGRGKNAISSD